ncbi:L-aspartate oxidase [Actinocrinis puniceicyclus]|uniref:L-aspartate oxidase n=1 Tax=Actinocrinis puniceicyclus TaxID=977794 RepID=A0A8J7WPD6_9ACTN|nr:L-aspartate oxidase [Actinocrinis puniceicyclus]MBS2966103.1 L-aspartate oxidase [Actinocrinis puniceicyclus]
MTRISRLLAPAPGWTAYADTVVVGSGIAGLTAALAARHAGSVLLVTKAQPSDGSTRWAQGGIAAALGLGDTPEAHLADTLTAGAGLCDPEAVRILVTEGPPAVRRLIERGAEFDRGADGSIALTREGGHHADRIIHAGGDATGAEVSRALLARLDKLVAEIEVIDHALVLDLLTDAAGRAAGLTLHVLGEGARDGVGAVRARAVVLATGGLGQVFTATTNPAVVTGDGVALALRAGAQVADLEFVQFHPTVLWLGDGARGQQQLISEAVRGEGAFLVDAKGERFMTGVHELADLAPRDIVAKAIMRRANESGLDHMWLDARHFGEDKWRGRFPTIWESLHRNGIDPVRDLIPVAPAAHYASGGVRTDHWGRTSIPGLYACGETACTGVHGANRLASNSLLEGLVFADRIGRDIARALGPGGENPPGEPADDARPQLLLDPSVRHATQQAMSAGAGVLRSAESLARTSAELRTLLDRADDDPRAEAWEATNLQQVATVLAEAAARREETRGSHWREDFPAADDARWRVRQVAQAGPEGVRFTDVPLAPVDRNPMSQYVRKEEAR